jgi:hypothetical protein
MRPLNLFLLCLFFCPSQGFTQVETEFYSTVLAMYTDLFLETEPQMLSPSFSNVAGFGIKAGAIWDSRFESSLSGVLNLNEELGILFVEQQNLFYKRLGDEKTIQFGGGIFFLAFDSRVPRSFNRAVGVELVLKYFPSADWMFQFLSGPMANSSQSDIFNRLVRIGVSHKLNERRPWWLTVEGSSLDFYSSANGNRTMWRTISAMISYGSP